MPTSTWEGSPIEEPLAKLELALIDEYLTAAGENPEAIRARHDAAARDLLTRAAIYASGRLTEVESRAHYVHDMHHSSER